MGVDSEDDLSSKNSSHRICEGRAFVKTSTSSLFQEETLAF